MDAISYKQKEYLYSYFRSKPPELNLHLHKYYEFLYFISGDATYIVEDNLYKIHPGDILLTKPGELHTIFFQSEKPYERIFMQIHPDFITEFDLFDKINSSPIGENNRIPSDIVQSFGLYDYFKKVEHYILNRVPESDAMIKSYFLQFLVAVNHALDNTVLPIKPTNNNRIDDIIDYLTDNISADITLDFLAEKFFINKYYMCHTFKKQTGITIKEFMNTRKITKAKQVLSEGADIMGLCYECGFNDYSTFYKAFKKLTGKSPKDFLTGD